MSQLDLFDICARNHGGNPQSVSARRQTHAETDRQRILNVIDAAGARGMTCDEVEALLLMSHQSCSARMSELKMFCQIVKHGVRPTRTGCDAAVMITLRFAPPRTNES